MSLNQNLWRVYVPTPCKIDPDNQMIFQALVVAAIDFGTTFSGWAYSFLHEYRSEPAKANVKQWNAGSGCLSTEKTPTCALISPDGQKLVAFGYEAENKYKILVENDEQRDYYYFKRFKMSLNKEVQYRRQRHA